MQDKYAGDIGDFGKFILLNAVIDQGSPRCRLGVNWYRVQGDSQPNNDGRHISYLMRPRDHATSFRQCNPALYTKLRRLVATQKRTIRHLERGGILPKNTFFFDQTIPVGDANRSRWFTDSLSHLQNADALFLDPDNGIAPSGVLQDSRRAVKYAFDHEIARYAAAVPLVIIYNHRDRTPGTLYRRKFERTRHAAGKSVQMRIVRFRRVSVRDYVFLFRRESRDWVDRIQQALTFPPNNFLFQEFRQPGKASGI